jgi:hypothetical protein
MTLWIGDVNCEKTEGCKCKIGGLRTNLIVISKIQGPNCKSVKELNYDLILGNGAKHK